MANVERLQHTLEFIQSNPEQWGQENWTTCFAGWAVRLNNPAITPGMDECGCCKVLFEDECPMDGADIQERASELLGLDERLTDEVFSAGNRLEDLELIVRELTEAQAVQS